MIIIQEYDFDVVICGGKDEKHYADELIRLSQNDRIHDFTGKTTFAEWSAIVQNAKLVVGNDSATMHLAAASSKKSVCVAGLYDKGHFFPYALDVLREGERLPRTVLVDMPCEYCRTIGYYSGYGNEKCKKMIQSGKCALCIDAISVDMVKQAIKEIM